MSGQLPPPDNPYASPRYEGAGFNARGYVRHVRLVAVLLIVQGSLEIVMSLFIAMTAIFLFSASMFPRNAPAGSTVPTLFAAGYGLVSAVTLIVGVTRIVAGFRNYRFRGRVLGIFALGAGLITLLTAYCAPTGIALAVYGLIVYLNSDVAQAFQQCAQGISPQQILEGSRM